MAIEWFNPNLLAQGVDKLLPSLPTSSASEAAVAGYYSREEWIKVYEPTPVMVATNTGLVPLPEVAERRPSPTHDVTAYVARISELMAEVVDLRADRDAEKWSREMHAELTADAVRHASSVTAELARLRAWLQWLSASSHVAVMALRGDPAPGDGL